MKTLQVTETELKALELSVKLAKAIIQGDNGLSNIQKDLKDNVFESDIVDLHFKLEFNLLGKEKISEKVMENNIPIVAVGRVGKSNFQSLKFTEGSVFDTKQGYDSKMDMYSEECIHNMEDSLGSILDDLTKKVNEKIDKIQKDYKKPIRISSIPRTPNINFREPLENNAFTYEGLLYQTHHKEIVDSNGNVQRIVYSEYNQDKWE